MQFIPSRMIRCPRRFRLVTMTISYILMVTITFTYHFMNVSNSDSDVKFQASLKEIPKHNRTKDVHQEQYLHESRNNVKLTYSDIVHLGKIHELTSKHVTGSYVVSLNSSEQMKYENSQAAFLLKAFTKTRSQDKDIVLEDFMKMGPFRLLPGFKSPCWYNEYHELRCLPFFFLIGAPKCGTTDIYTLLQFHPSFQSDEKEPHWITRFRFKTHFNAYTAAIARPLVHQIHNGSGHFGMSKKKFLSAAVLGDCSASTLYDNFNWPLLEGNTDPLEPRFTNADYVYHLNKKAKIIAILRNPISRLYSHYIYFDKTHMLGPESFHHDVVEKVRAYRKCFQQYSIRSCVYSPTTLSKSKVTRTTIKAWVRLDEGIYFIHLLEWYRVFPIEQIMVLHMEDYSENRAETMLKVYDFLTLDSKEINQTVFNTYVNFTRPQNSNRRIEYQNTSMWEQTRHILYKFYKPFNRALANLLEDPKFDYGPY